jgi:hypothetical protein
MFWFLQNVRQTPHCQKKSGDSGKKGDIRRKERSHSILSSRKGNLINVNMAEKVEVSEKNSV